MKRGWMRGGAAVLALAAAAAGAPALAQWNSKAPTGFEARAIDRGFIVGAWTDSDDCEEAIAFDEDGTFVTPGGAEGQWELVGDALTLSGAGGERQVIVVALDPDTMEVIDEEGGHGRSTRCAAIESEARDPNFVARGVT